MILNERESRSEKKIFEKLRDKNSNLPLRDVFFCSLASALMRMLLVPKCKWKWAVLAPFFSMGKREEMNNSVLHLLNWIVINMRWNVIQPVDANTTHVNNTEVLFNRITIFLSNTWRRLTNYEIDYKTKRNSIYLHV